MTSNYERYANAVRIQYLAYEESKKNPIGTKYMKHLPYYLKEIPEFTDDKAMLFNDVERNELIYAMRGLDVNLIAQGIPSALIGSVAGAGAGFIGGKSMAGAMRLAQGTEQPYKRTGIMAGAGAGFTLGGNSEMRTALDILLSGAFKEKVELDEETGQLKEFNARFINDYRNDLNREIEKINQIRNTFPNKKLILSAHSRGGAKARDLSNLLGIESHIFNPAETSVYGNIFLQTVLPILFSDARFYSRGFTRNALMQGYAEEEASLPFTEQVYAQIQGQPTAVVVPGEIPPPARLVRTVADDARVEFIRNIIREYPTLQANIFNPTPQLNAFLLSQEHDFGEFGHETEGEAALIRTAIAEAANDAPISFHRLAQASARYLSNRYGANLIKYSLQGAAGERGQGGRFMEYAFNPYVSSVGTVMAGAFAEQVMNPKDRIKEPNKKINVYRTPDDLVSMGYDSSYDIEPRDYVPRNIIEYFIGQHNMDHFINKELYDSIRENRALEQDALQEEEVMGQIESSRTPQPAQEKSSRLRGQVEQSSSLAGIYNEPDVRDRTMEGLFKRDIRKEQPKTLPAVPTKQSSRTEPSRTLNGSEKKTQQQLLIGPPPIKELLGPPPPKEFKQIEKPNTAIPPQATQTILPSFNPNELDINIGTPSFSKINPYYLCKSNPNLPGCDEILNN